MEITGISMANEKISPLTSLLNHLETKAHNHFAPSTYGIQVPIIEETFLNKKMDQSPSVFGPS